MLILPLLCCSDVTTLQICNRSSSSMTGLDLLHSKPRRQALQGPVRGDGVVGNQKVRPGLAAMCALVGGGAFAPSDRRARFGAHLVVFHFAGAFRLTQEFGVVGLDDEVRLVGLVMPVVNLEPSLR